MSSNRLRKVYDSRRWRAVRLQVLERDGFQCRRQVWDPWACEWVRCQVRDHRVGGTESLTVQHLSEHADPYDDQYLVTLCRRHHGQEDGARGAARRYGRRT